MNTAIVGYEGLYEICDDGRVLSIPHTVTTGVTTFMSKNRELRQYSNKAGYRQVWLSNKGKRKGYLVHRLVAEAYIANPSKLPQVNHKNGNTGDNHVSNLEWMTQLDNIRHSYRDLGRKNLPGELQKGSRQVEQHLVTGELVKVHPTLHQAAKNTGILASSISNCIKGRSKSAGGFKWVALPHR